MLEACSSQSSSSLSWTIDDHPRPQSAIWHFHFSFQRLAGARQAKPQIHRYIACRGDIEHFRKRYPERTRQRPKTKIRSVYSTVGVDSNPFRTRSDHPHTSRFREAIQMLRTQISLPGSAQNRQEITMNIREEIRQIERVQYHYKVSIMCISFEHVETCSSSISLS